jgi:hypothetical protein
MSRINGTSENGGAVTFLVFGGQCISQNLNSLSSDVLLVDVDNAAPCFNR